MIELPLRYKSYYRNKNRFKSYDSKLDVSISRAKSKVLDYVTNNDFKYFVTLTLNNNLDSYDLASISRFFSQRIRDIRKKYKIDLKYIFIPEKHKKGNYHLHGFMSADIDFVLYTNEHFYKSCKEFDFAGYQNFSTIRNYNACSKYVLKYITKDLAEIGKGKHLYFCSQGLATSKKYCDIVVSNYFPDFDFVNDFCSLKYNVDNDDINNLYNHYYDNYN